jgi:hypothetical protein
MSVRAVAIGVCLAVLSACRPAAPTPWLGHPASLAPGVELYRSTDDTLVESVGPIAIFLVKIDPAKARIASVLSNDRVLDAELVVDIAKRHRAIAAINGGFFNRTNGEPTGVLKVAGELVSDASEPRGAVIVRSPPGGPTELFFDRLSAKVTMTVQIGDDRWTVPVYGVDTTRVRGKVMLYTPAYHPHSDTAPTGTEWVLDGDPLTVTAIRSGAGQTPIPAKGAVLSFGGLRPPDELAALEVGAHVSFTTNWKGAFGTPAAVLDEARHIVTGAGLIRRGGAVVDWKDEKLDVDSFTGARHPRTLVGADRGGAIWLVAVDGRQPDYSIGMTFADLGRLADRLQLTGALNLDGGGSTTLVALDHVVNRPSDAGGRPVADAIIVTGR